MKRGKKVDSEGTEPDALLSGMGEYLKEHGRREVVIDPAKQLYQMAKAGDADAQYEMGSWVVRAGSWSDAAEQWLRKAARNGHLEAKRLIVRHLNPGRWGCSDEEVERWMLELFLMGDPQAQYAQAFSVDAREDRVQWLEKSAAQGYAPAMVELGYRYADGWDGIEMDMGRAVELFRGAAVQGDMDALCIMGKICAEGRGVEADPVEAVRWLEKPLKKEVSQAFLTMGHINEACRDAESLRKAMECYRRAARAGYWGGVYLQSLPRMNCRGHSEAAYHVGRLYHDGIGVGRDDSEAAKWFGFAAKESETYYRYPGLHFELLLDAMHYAEINLHACRQDAERGSGDAEAAMGLHLFRMRGGDFDNNDEAKYWIERSAHRGHPLGQYAWGGILEHWRGVMHLEEVATWYRKAADQGLPEAQAEMGRYYLGGEYWQERGAVHRLPNGEWDENAIWILGCFIVRQPDFRQAAKWLRRAAEGGVMPAQFELGYLYVRGDGVEQDLSSSASWWRQALEWSYKDWTASIRQRFAGKWMKH